LQKSFDFPKDREKLKTTTKNSQDSDSQAELRTTAINNANVKTTSSIKIGYYIFKQR
jgi:hypothetical protein